MFDPMLSLPAPQFLEIGGARIATWLLEPAGTPAGEVVLCHGTPWSARVWAALAQLLAAEQRVFLWDLPGYGHSTMDPAVRVDLRAQMARFAELCRRWGVRRPQVIAHDIGGAVALGAHLLHGVDYASLFLWDVVTLDPWGSPFFRLVGEHAEVFEQLPPALHRALVTEYIAGAGRHRLPVATVRRLAEPWLDAPGQAAFYRQIAALDPADTRPLVERLDRVSCPVRIGWGGADPWLPVEQAYRLRAALPGAPTVVELAGVGHLAPLERPDEVADAVAGWLGLSRGGAG